MSEQTAPTAEGWYDDPKRPGYARFWDGTDWTELQGRARNHPDRVRTKRLANLIGWSCLLVALVFTFAPASARGYDCGTWISPESYTATTPGSVFGAANADVVNQDCRDKLDTRRLFALVLLGIGAMGRWGIPYASRQEYDQ